METINDYKRLFGGIYPKVAAHNLGERSAQQAINVEIRHTTLAPSKKNRLTDIDVPVGTKTLFQKENGEWLFFDGKAYVESTPYSEDIHDRTFVSFEGETYQEAGDGTRYRMGVQRPIDAPTLTTIEADNDAEIEIEQAFEKENGAIIERSVITPTVVEENGLWTLAIPAIPDDPDSADPLNPDPLAGEWIFIATGTQNTASLGVAYSDNSSRAVASDLFINGFKATLTLTNTSLALSLSGESISDVDELRFYVYTLVNTLGQESGYSPVSQEIFVKTGNAVNVTIPQTYDATDIEFIRLYRTTDAATFKRVAELPVGTILFNDNTVDRFLPEAPIDIANWDEAPEGLSSLVLIPNQYFVGHVDKTVYVTQAGDFHAWRLDLGQNTRHPIRAISPVFENLVYIFTEEEVYIGSGLTPDEFSLLKIEAPHPLRSLYGIADAGRYGIAWCSSDGLHLARGTDVRLLTKSRFTKAQWTDLKPENMSLAYADEVLLLSTENGTYLFWLDESEDFGLTQDSLIYTASHVDAKQDKLFLISDDRLVVHRDSDEINELTWTSPVTLNRVKFDWKVLRIQTEVNDEAVLFSLFRSGVKVWEKEVVTNRDYKIPFFGRSRRWHYELKATIEIIEVQLSTSYQQV